MKLKTKELSQALNVLNGVKANIAVKLEQSVLISADAVKGIATLSARRDNVSMQYTINCEANEDYAVCISSDALSKLASCLTDDIDIESNADTETITIKHSNGAYTIPAVKYQNAEGEDTFFSLPSLEDTEDNPIQRVSLIWASCKGAIAHCLSLKRNDELRVFVNQTRLECVDGKVTWVRTDGRALIRARYDEEDIPEYKLTLPNIVCSTLLKCDAKTLKLANNKNYISATLGCLKIIARTEGGDYPNFARVISTHDNYVSANTHTLRNIVNRMGKFGAKTIKIEAKYSEIILTARDDMFASSEVMQGSLHAPEETYIGTQTDLFTWMLARFAQDNVRLYLDNSSRPFYAIEQHNEMEVLVLLMPCKVDEE
jgi:DNA polymerase III sliding clamp (beta) subunit (PCNA family)